MLFTIVLNCVVTSRIVVFRLCVSVIMCHFSVHIASLLLGKPRTFGVVTVGAVLVEFVARLRSGLLLSDRRRRLGVFGRVRLLLNIGDVITR